MRFMINAGTLTEGKTARMSASLFIRKSATAAAGLAEARKYAPSHSSKAGLPIMLGNTASKPLVVPHVSGISLYAASRSSRVGAHG